MIIKYNEDVPELKRNRSEVYGRIVDFLASDNDSMTLECEDAAEASKTYTNARNATYVCGLPAVATKRGLNIYIKRKDGE